MEGRLLLTTLIKWNSGLLTTDPGDTSTFFLCKEDHGRSLVQRPEVSSESFSAIDKTQSTADCCDWGAAKCKEEKQSQAGWSSKTREH